MLTLVPNTDSRRVLFPLEITAVLVHLLGENSGLSTRELAEKVNHWGQFTTLAACVLDASDSGFEWTRENIELLAIGVGEERLALMGTMPHVLRPIDDMLESLFITF